MRVPFIRDEVGMGGRKFAEFQGGGQRSPGP